MTREHVPSYTTTSHFVLLIKLCQLHTKIAHSNLKRCNSENGWNSSENFSEAVICRTIISERVMRMQFHVQTER